MMETILHAAPRQAVAPWGAVAPSELLIAAMDGLAHGLALFDQHGHTLYANAAARRAMVRQAEASADGDTHNAGRWHEALGRVCRRGKRELFELAAPSGHGEDGAFVVLVPVATSGSEGLHHAFAIFGRDEIVGAVELQMFALRHGLTAAETQVLRQLSRGLKAGDIARAHGVTLATVLTQISAVRHKTACGSVRELLARLARMPQATALV